MELDNKWIPLKKTNAQEKINWLGRKESTHKHSIKPYTLKTNIAHTHKLTGRLVTWLELVSSWVDCKFVNILLFDVVGCVGPGHGVAFFVGILTKFQQWDYAQLLRIIRFISILRRSGESGKRNILTMQEAIVFKTAPAEERVKRVEGFLARDTLRFGPVDVGRALDRTLGIGAFGEFGVSGGMNTYKNKYIFGVFHKIYLLIP